MILAQAVDAGAPFLPRTPATIDIQGQFVLLGTGTSVGVPSIGCDCPVCTSTHPKNRRTRCGAVVGLPQGNLLIDTPVDLRSQLLREQIGIVHAVVFTHEHADHIFGLDDLRLFPSYLGRPVPLYCEGSVRRRILKSFDYAFDPPRGMHAGGVPQLELHTISTQPFHVLGVQITPVRLRHAANVEVLGFRLGNIAYCTDTNGIPDESMALLEGLDVLILDALRARPHATHFSLAEAIEVAHKLKPRRTLFTHVSHELEHETTCARLPEGMELAYDGMRISLT
jgi:phosphoribosyl 1,2-cyclic phosphate phosphodiesterase